MAEEIVSAPIETAPVVVQEAQLVPELDLISRVSNFKKNQNQQVAKPSVDVGFDYKEIENIQDPIAKDIAIKAYKSMEAGVQKKFQDLASQRRELETKQQELVNQAQNWSPERIQRELLNNPQFLQAAKQVAGTDQQNPSGLTEEQYSALTDREKAELSTIKNQNSVLANEINSLKQINYQAVVAQHDARLQQKFSDYNPVEINDAINRLSQMNPVDIREYVYKAQRFEDSVKAAYELGRSEKTEFNQQKINAFSPSGAVITNSDGMPVRDKSDNDMAWFQKIANFRLAQSKKK